MTDLHGDVGARQPREALAEIPRQLRQLRQPVTPTTRLTNQIADLFSRTVLNPTVVDSPINNIPLSFLSPTLSPDEMVIRQRGRRSLPIIWSPEPGRPPSPLKTPTKSNGSPTTTPMTLRSSPRKRLMLADYPTPVTPDKSFAGRLSTPGKRSSSSPMKNSAGPTAIKKIRFEDTSIHRVDRDVPLNVVLKGMSHDQLIEIIQNMVQQQPKLEEKIREKLPVPDLKPQEEQLQKAKKAIFKSLPTTRLVSKTDSSAYSKASMHLVEFKK
jgi:Cut8, nuclear proteasome tether protein